MPVKWVTSFTIVWKSQNVYKKKFLKSEKWLIPFSTLKVVVLQNTFF